MVAKQKILLVDDRPENLVALEAILESTDRELVSANSGQEALAYLLKSDFALVLLDVQMPEMDGFEVAKLMQKNNRTRRIPIIFVTAISKEDKFVFKGYRSGAVDYLFKPINAEFLQSKVEVFLGLDKQRRQLEDNLVEIKQLTEENDLILNSIAEGIIGTDKLGNITFVNPAAKFMLKRRDDNTINKHLFEVIFAQDKVKKSDGVVWEDSYLHKRCSNGEEYHVDNEKFTNADIVSFPVEYRATPVHDEAEQFNGLVLVFQDITDRKLAEERLIQLARYDSLTGLANRTLFLDLLHQSVSRAQRTENTLALLFLDLDRFKQVNDSLGHDAGDALLQEVATRFRSCIREGDIISRLGGDEFTILLEAVVAREAAIVAQKVINSLAQPFNIQGQEIFMSTSIGIATFPGFAVDPDNLLKSADMAMYHAKGQGRSNYQFFTPGMQKTVVERLNIENKLRQALDKSEFMVYFQPQFDIHTTEIVGLEALIRWQPNSEEIVSPAKFIPIAEETGLILPIGEWVLNTACQHGAEWFKQGLIGENITIAVNLSIRQLNKDLIATIKKALKKSGLRSSQLELELTESMVMDDVQTSKELLDAIHSLGVHISIDDFGTGYSSLNSLKHLPLDVLKIDQSFVADIGKDSHGEAIIKAITAMAKSLNLKIVAEGIETEQQLAFLRKNDCNCIQGYYFNGPLSVQDATKLLQKIKQPAVKLSG